MMSGQRGNRPAAVGQMRRIARNKVKLPELGKTRV